MSWPSSRRCRATLVFYDTAPRLVDSLEAIGAVLPGREVAVARELTKRFEECRSGSPAELAAHYAAHPPKGEIVLHDRAAARRRGRRAADADALLRAELALSKPSQAAAAVAQGDRARPQGAVRPRAGAEVSAQA